MIRVHGHWASGCESLITTFADNFNTLGERGAALAIYRHGQPWLSIWAGTRQNSQADLQAEWQEDTRVNIFSASKGLVAAGILQLVAQGDLALDQPVARYWSEFAAAGKDSITVRQVLCHRAGLSAFHTRLKERDIFDWDTITQTIAAEEPWWEPGSAQGYSPFIYGWILGELVRRISGYESFNAFFQAQIAQPLALGCSFGVAEDQLSSLADTAPLKAKPHELPPTKFSESGVNTGADSASLGRLMKADPRGVTNRAFVNPMSLMSSSNTTAWRQAQIPAANCHASARDLAAIYSALGNGNLINKDHLSLCWEPQTAEQDRVLGLPLRFSCGFMLSQDRLDCRFGRGERAFGHPGAGGSLGFADPDYGIGFGYVTARMGQNLLIDPRVIRLIDAIYALPEIKP